MCARVPDFDGRNTSLISTLRVGRSKLKTTFTDSTMSYGLFTDKVIEEGDVFARVESTLAANDYIDYTAVAKATTNEEMYLAWRALAASYYDLDTIKSRVNVMTVLVESDGNRYLRALRRIEPGEELVRCYGFTTWIVTDPGIDVALLPGMLRFLDEFVPTMGEDPMGSEVRSVHQRMKTIAAELGQ
jgi:hypothetical protein